MEEWKEYKLEEVCSRLRSGKGIKSDCISNTGLFPVIGGNGMRGYTNKSNFKGECAVIGRQGANCGNVRFFMGEAYMTEHAVVAVGNELADSYFLARLLSLMHLGNLSAQSAQPGLSIQTLSKQVIRLPSISYQREISTVLKSLDDKIELNRRINDNLEQQAQALFKSWFVDNPDSNWANTSLSEVASFVGGYSYKSEELTDFSNVAMATIKNFGRNRGFKAEGFKGINPSAKLKECHCVNLFDILVAHTDLTQNADVIGNAELLLTCGKYNSIIFSMDLVKVLPKEIFPYKFLLAAMLKNKIFKGHCLGYINGTTVLHLNKKALPEFEIRKPSDSEAKIMNETLAPYYKRMAKLLQETDKLISLRDTLLPKLMSGEVKINETNN
ncbi:type I restriction modification DNA specificity domain protein [Prevotella disiens JCM 6334 = ATCC 29426]|uniref:Predicted nucleotidyltransferases n=3 Tax=Prevotellaceae TaxID=171552 RepID=A0A379DXF8_9BACT|nr:restriction endonuclease subunit S [Prevotella disiens]ERJ78967.1 type I restriction modification DNA specificity domain protein [Prevotella disiens JCM 6334 = ATCC 29426]SUB84754.1 Predicted nucleotidyltransferases [Prevotella disiens]